MSFSFSTFIADIEAIGTDIKNEAAKFEAWLTKAMPAIQEAAAAASAALPYLTALDPELAKVPGLAAVITAAPQVAQSALVAAGSTNVTGAITATAATLTAIGEAAENVLTGGALKSTTDSLAKINSIATTTVNLITSAVSAVQTATAVQTAAPAQTGT